jgi:Domain of unknown function (DUF4831)
MKAVAVIAAIVSISICTGCASKIIVQRVPPVQSPPTPTSVNGVLYALPRTVVQVHVPLIKTEREQGRFCGCLDNTTGIPLDFLKEAGKACKALPQEYTVKAASLGTRGVADPNQVFVYRVQGGPLEDRTAAFTISDDLILTDGQAESTNNTVELVTKIIGAASGIASKTFFADAPQNIHDTCAADASAAWQEIVGLTLRRNALVDGLATSNLDGAALSAALQDYDTRIAARKQSGFLGSKTESVAWDSSFEVDVPDTASSGASYDLFQFVATGDAAGVCGSTPSPVVNLTPLADATASCPPEARRVSVQLFNVNKLVLDAFNGPEPQGDNGFRYRVPAPATWMVQLTVPGKTATQLARSDLPIAQLGKTVALPASSKGRRTSYTVGLNPATGGLRSFKLGSDALIQKSAVDDISGAANSLIDARTKQIKDQKDAADQLTQLTRQRQILEEQVKIKDAQTKLNP